MSSLKDALRDVVRALEARKAQASAAVAGARAAYVYERDTGVPGEIPAAPAAPRAESPSAWTPPPARAARGAPTRPVTEPLASRVRLRAREPGAVREAFVLKEILDRPVSLRRSR